MKDSSEKFTPNLTVELIELVRLRIGYLNDCPYSISLHYKELVGLGEHRERLSLVSVWDQVPYFTKKERALFALTDYIIGVPSKLKYDRVKVMLMSHFNKSEIETLSKAIRQIDQWTRSVKHL